MKKILFPILLFAVFFVSCSTIEPIYTALGENSSQLVFLRPITIKKIDNSLKAFDFDVTCHVKDGTFIRNPVLNFSVTVPKDNASYADKAMIQLACGDIVCVPREKSVIYKNIDGKNLVSRFSTQIDIGEFVSLLKKDSDVKIRIVSGENILHEKVNKDLNVRLNDLRILLYAL